MFTLHTYNGKQFPALNRIYILNKGENSGKPSLMPFVNSFVCTCQDQQEAELLYILSYGLWQAQQFRPFLRGSVIEFITIDDLHSLLFQAYTEAQAKPLFIETVRKVMQVDRLIAARKAENEQLNKLKIALVVHHFRPKVK
jgi:hypothetical protein